MDAYVFGWIVSGKPNARFTTCAKGNQTQANPAATTPREPQMMPIAPEITRSIPTITMGLTSPPKARVSTAAIPAPAMNPALFPSNRDVCAVMQFTLHCKVMDVKTFTPSPSGIFSSSGAAPPWRSADLMPGAQYQATLPNASSSEGHCGVSSSDPDSVISRSSSRRIPNSPRM